jgi:hypothetical protein
MNIGAVAEVDQECSAVTCWGDANMPSLLALFLSCLRLPVVTEKAGPATGNLPLPPLQPLYHFFILILCHHRHRQSFDPAHRDTTSITDARKRSVFSGRLHRALVSSPRVLRVAFDLHGP